MKKNALKKFVEESGQMLTQMKMSRKFLGGLQFASIKIEKLRLSLQGLS